MPKNPDDFKETPDTEEHIQALQRRAEALAGGELSFFESADMSEGLRAQFWEQVVAYEEAPLTTSFDLLTQAGVDLPTPEALDDAQLSAKLWEVIRGMAMLRMFLYSTNHLSDRELYEELWHEVLRDEHPAMPMDEYSAWHIDLLGSGSTEDTQLWLRYYADEEDRRHWAERWPGDAMPTAETPPYDRDRLLPARGQPVGSPDGGRAS